MNPAFLLDPKAARKADKKGTKGTFDAWQKVQVLIQFLFGRFLIHFKFLSTNLHIFSFPARPFKGPSKSTFLDLDQHTFDSYSFCVHLLHTP